MKKFIFLLLLVVSFPAYAGLVEINSSNFLRSSGSPETEVAQVTLENAGEIRIANINLQDDSIELAESTVLEINGATLLSPFHLPTGGSVVFPLDAGSYYLTATVKGKPGGGIKVTFYEDKPDAPVQGKGWELLDDGTALNKKSGLIWHRNPATPGIIPHDADGARASVTMSDAQQYIDDLNSGFYGIDPIHGNAGHSDWRLPSVTEFLSSLDLRVLPPFSKADGSVEVFASPRFGFLGGMPQMDVILWCWNPDEWGGWLDQYGLARCDKRFILDRWLTSDPYLRDGYLIPNQVMNVTPWYTDVLSASSSGQIWPVRGGN